MFHKEGTFSLPGGKKSQDTPLRKSDRRKLRDRFISSLFGLENDEKLQGEIGIVADAIFMDLSSDILYRKMKIPGYSNSAYIHCYLRTSSTLSDVWPYHSTTQPILIEMMNHPYPCTPINLSQRISQGKTNMSPINWNQEKIPTPILIPTLAILSILPIETFDHIIPTITIPSSVSKFLCRGAHLMRAGMSPRFCSLPHSDCLKHTRGLVALKIHGNPQPFAMGFLTPGTTLEALRLGDSEKNKGLSNSMNKGIGVLIVTWQVVVMMNSFFARQSCCSNH